MDSFEINKILGAVLATLLIVVALNIIADMVFTAPTPEQPGYEIAVVEDDPDAEVAEEPELPLGNLLAAADPAAGEAAVRPCATCHTFDQGGENRVGPNLYDVVGAEKAHIEGFNFSTPMQEAGAAGQTWDYEELDAFLADPRGYMPGTTMAFAGVRDPETRADIIMFLREHTEDPPPLPEPEEEVAEAPEDEEAAEPAAEDETEAAEGDNGLIGMIAAADPAAGESAARPCVTCHTFEQGGGNRVGPNLFDVVGGPKAHLDDFNYSGPMQEAGEAGETWGYEELDAFLADPRGYMPGTTMAFAGVRDAEARASIIAYMREMSEDPPPLEGAE